MPQYWLMKSEPYILSIDDLQNTPKQTVAWEGVRNYQARNYMRDQMCIGDLMFFYHSSCTPPGIVGIAEIVSQAYPDYTALDPTSPYFDKRSTANNPRWFMVDVRFKKKFPQMLSLQTLRQYPQLQKMILLRKGNRLSIMPVSSEEWTFIVNNL